jgi:NAD(P)-dependent dehydrogenase (short-subunit alcohol dehydrogenase family)
MALTLIGGYPKGETMPFRNQVAIVTGGSSGIGRATAIAFARAGAQVAVVDVQEVAGQAVVKEIQGLGRKAIYINADMSKEADIKSMVSQTVHEFGRLDIAFNNAGVEGETAKTADATIENWERVISINLRGVWLCMKYEIPEMLKTGGGVIVNCSSIAGLVAFAGIPAYVASKHGVIGLTKTAAMEYARANVRVNAVCPGVIQTPMIDRFSKYNEAAKRQLAESEPIGRVGQPEEIADAVVWLCSPQASFVTGHAMAIDGGWVAQ